jgi:hypothetical protein
MLQKQNFGGVNNLSWKGKTPQPKRGAKTRFRTLIVPIPLCYTGGIFCDASNEFRDVGFTGFNDGKIPNRNREFSISSRDVS